MSARFAIAPAACPAIRQMLRPVRLVVQTVTVGTTSAANLTWVRTGRGRREIGASGFSSLSGFGIDILVLAFFPYRHAVVESLTNGGGESRES